MSEITEQPVTPVVPAKYRAISVILLVNGALNVMIGVGIVWAAISSVVGIILLLCCAAVIALPMVLGVFEIVYGAKMASNQPVNDETIRRLAIFEMVNIAYGNVISLVAGVLNYIFLGEDEVRKYML